MSKGLERSNLVASLGKPGSTTATKREQEVSINKPGKTKKLRFQPLDCHWGERESLAPLGGEIEVTTVLKTSDMLPLEDTGTNIGGWVTTLAPPTDHQEPTTTPTPMEPSRPKVVPQERNLRQESILTFISKPTIEGKACANLARAATPPPTTTTMLNEDSVEEVVQTTPAISPLVQDTALESPTPRSNTTTTLQGAEVGTSNVGKTTIQGCLFKRGGLCTTHNVVGIRSTKQTKSWKQKKDGTFGYITSKKIVYTCRLEDSDIRPALELSAALPDSETDGVASNGTISKYISEGLSSNFENVDYRKKSSESPPPD